ncbi:MAG: acyl-CoA dehydrogenase family protein, partial [Alphaproteobacteria bacterium]
MDFAEPEHVAALRETIRRFLAREMPPAEAQRWDREDKFPRPVFD